jgi:hypothetical protein
VNDSPFHFQVPFAKVADLRQAAHNAATQARQVGEPRFGLIGDVMGRVATSLLLPANRLLFVAI